MTAAPVPIARLLAMAYRQLIDGLHARLAARGYPNVNPSYGYVLLAAREAPVSSGDVASLLGVSKQAASKMVAAMEAGGYVRQRPDPADARARRISLTPRGRRFLVAVEGIYRELEAEWAETLGAPRVESLRGDLVTVLEALHGGALPTVRRVG